LRPQRCALDHRAYSDLGMALQQQGNLAEALEQFKQAIQLDPTNTNAEDNLKAVEQLISEQKSITPL